VAFGFSPIDPIKALCWDAGVNGIILLAIMEAMMVAATPGQRIFGWAANVIMAMAVTTMVLVM